jgi:hypothetical protein
MKLKQQSRAFGIGIVVFCLALWFLVIPTQTKGNEAAFFPRLITILILIPGILFIATRRGISEGSTNKTYNKEGIIRVIVTAFAFGAYLFMVKYIGFFTSSFIVIIALMAYYGVKSWKKFILIPSILLLFIYFIIERFLGFPLPNGWIF